MSYEEYLAWVALNSKDPDVRDKVEKMPYHIKTDVNRRNASFRCSLCGLSIVKEVKD